MTAKWITVTPAPDASALYIFKKRFSVTKAVESFVVRISADTRYRLYINGKELAHGPCQSTQYVKYYEELDCKNALVQGENEISIQLLHISPRIGYSFTTAPHHENPALYFDGTLVCEGKMEKIVSDESFAVSRVKNVSFFHPASTMRSLAPFESVEGDAEYQELACCELYTPHIEDNSYGSWGVKELYRIEKRPIQLLELLPKVPLPSVREYYDENGSYNIILDAGAYTTAMLRYEFQAPQGTKLKLIYAECMRTPGEDGSLGKDMRDNIDGVIPVGVSDSNHYDELTASGNTQTYEPFWYRAFRFIRVECSRKPEHFRASAARYTYNFETDALRGGIGSFHSSDSKYAKLWEVSRNTLECCTHETFADCPFYEQQQYVGDGRFESVYAWKLSNDSRMQKKLIIDTAHSLQTDGQIATTSPNMWTQIIHVSNFYFVNLIREYLRFTDDRAFVKTQIGALSCNIAYFESTKTPEGLINPPDGCHFIDWASAWKKGHPEGGDKAPMAIYNLMYAASLRDAAEICEACDYQGLATDYRALHANLVAAVNKYFYNEEVGLYADLPGEKSFSEHANVWAILSDAVTGDAANALAERMMNCSFIVKSSFSKNYDLLRALDKAGCYEKYADKILVQWDDMLEKHCTTWCESLSFPRSECHGWSCTPMYEMSAMILGVTPREDGYRKVRIKPFTMGLDFANGRIPTPYGYIDVAWKRKDGSFSLSVSSNEQIEMELILPGGTALTVVSDQYTVTE